MLDLDHAHEIWTTLRRNKLRTTLTAFGVFWGIFLLMIMLGSGTGLENGAFQGFADGATNSFFVWTQTTTKPYRGLPAGRNFSLDNADVAAIRAQLPEVGVIAPRNQLGGYRGGNNVVHEHRTGGFTVMGDYPEIRAIQPLRIERGRFLNATDITEKRKIAVIGTRVRELLFERGEEPLGEYVEVNGVPFLVVGVFGSPRSGDQGDRETQTVYVPFSTFQQAFNYGERVGWLAVTSRDDLPASLAQQRVLTLLRQRHDVAPDDERALGSFNSEEEYLKLRGLFLGIRTLIWIVGLGTLAAGAIGVSNIMLVIVRERTRELGVRRAIGATPLRVMGEIVVEAVLLTSSAGYLGLIGGMLLVDGVARAISAGGARPTMFDRPGVAVASALEALGLLVAAGMLAGVVPATRAVKIRPVAALRAE